MPKPMALHIGLYMLSIQLYIVKNLTTCVDDGGRSSQRAHQYEAALLALRMTVRPAALIEVSATNAQSVFELMRDTAPQS